ncbi:hypothetical protein SB57_10080, partial [Lactobacillus delbrueckii subsp. bulgaricus]
LEDEDDEVKLLVNFDGNEVAYTQADLNNLTRAYAITIHKSQGSEFPLVILCLTMQNYIYAELYHAQAQSFVYGHHPGLPRSWSWSEKSRLLPRPCGSRAIERRTNLVWLLKDRFKPEEQSKQESSEL